MSEKRGLGRLLEKIGSFFKGLFDAAERAYNKLQPEVKKAMVQASGVLDILNKHVNESPDFVIEIIQKAFPELTREKMLEGLNKVSEGLNVVDAIEADTLEETVRNLQAYLEGLKDQRWAAATSFAAKILALFLSPQGIKYSIIEMLMEMVYQRFIKKD